MNKAGGKEQSKRRILVVEDNKVNQKILVKLLGDEYDLIMADDGLQGLDILKKEYRNLSLILLDVMMPVCDGFQFLEQIRNDAILSSVPIIVTTGSDGVGDEEKSLELGAYDFVTKPYRPNIVKKRVRNIIKLKESASTLSAIEYDELTGLLTKHAFYHHVQSRFRKEPDLEYDVIIADVENFKLINDRYGEEKADEVLKYIADQFRQHIPNSISARFSGDQFVSLSCGFTTEDKNEFCSNVCKMIENSPIPNLIVKFGIYENVDKSLTVSAICNRALMALNRVKRQYGRDYGFFDEELQQRINKFQRIVDSMETALAEEQYQVYYQPKHDAMTGKIVGAEALVRWIHPEYGFMSPGDFIPTFENNGFITQLDIYVWTHVCRDLKEWQETGSSMVPISINASRKDFSEITDIAFVRKNLEKFELDPSWIHLEVTESFYTERTDELIEIVKSVQDLGIQIELDDFGSGYSSLGMLKKLPLDIIKLDMSFVRQLDIYKDIVEVIIELAHKLGFKTVAEGVETEEQLEKLKEMGCDTIQGYYFSKPLPKKEFELYLKDHEI